MQKTREEIDAMSPAQYKAYRRGQDDIVFGVDAPRGPKGRPIEQGIGSALQPSENSVRAYRAHIHAGGRSPTKAELETLAQQERALAEYLARKPAPSEDEAA